MIKGIQGEFDFRGFKIYGAFAVIDTIQSSNENCSASVNIYASEQAFSDGEGYLKQIYPVQFQKIIGDNVADDQTQAYNFLKTTEEFKNWDFL